MKKFLTVLVILSLLLCSCNKTYKRPEPTSTSAPIETVDTDDAVLNNNGYTNDELCKMASAYYKAINGVAPPIVDIDREEGDNVVLHLYEYVTDHTATWAWYEINRYTGTGQNTISGEYIDLSLYNVNYEEQTNLSKTYNYDKILNGDLSDFVGLWKNAEGYTIELDEHGEKNDPVYDNGKVFHWQSCDFEKENGCYYWSEVLDTGDYGESYVIYLFPIGVEIVNPYSKEVTPSDITKVRLCAGQDFSPEPNDVFYFVK